VGIGCAIVLVALFLLFGKTVRDLYKHGFLDAYFAQDQTRKYDASSENNLTMLYKAMMLYHESEGQFPKSNGWMDAVKSFGAASDLAKGESEKKFVTPSLAGKPGQFGYAMNDVASGKYKGDIKDPKTILIFDSSDTSRNAHGDPKKLLPSPPRTGGNLGIAVDGTIVKL
jgi:hypothetical protein